MKHDPLLGKNWDPPKVDQASHEAAPIVARSPRREKHPALSSRILATGFSVAAVLGMSTAYAKAQKSQDLQKLIDEQIAAANQNASTVPTPGVQSQNAPADLAPAVTPNTTPTDLAPATTVAPNTTTSTTPNIVQVPVQPAQPATPAYNPPSNNRGNQSSGGSR